jgi:hypothetical protein
MVTTRSKSAKVNFGYGTTKIAHNGTSLVLTSCKVTPIGDEAPKRSAKGSDTLTLDFKYEAALDVLIEKLEQVRESLREKKS